MPHKPKIYHRKSIRLESYDYTRAGAYFITICCENRKARFGKVESGEMIFNRFGWIAYKEWMKIPPRFINCDLDVFQIMPNHMHGIIILKDHPIEGAVGAGLTPASNTNENVDIDKRFKDSRDNMGIGINESQKNDLDDGGDNYADLNIENGPNIQKRNKATARVAPTGLGGIVGAYKSLVANECLKICKSENVNMGKIWQRNYYEHIIRNEKSYQNISAYIINNPKKWNEDKFYNK